MISMDKKYKYRNGEPARVLCVDQPHIHRPVLAMGSDGVVTAHMLDGRKHHGVDQESPYDLIEVNPWGDFKIDEPVLVRDSDHDDWARGNFAGVGEDGRPRVWDAGTKWSSLGYTEGYGQCRRPTTEELGETK